MAWRIFEISDANGENEWLKSSVKIAGFLLGLPCQKPGIELKDSAMRRAMDAGLSSGLMLKE